jgi:deoxyribonuclease V
MKIKPAHSWNLSTQEARDLQVRMAGEVITTSGLPRIRFIAGVDVSKLSHDTGRAAIVILSSPELKIVELKTMEGDYSFPYVPGLLSFREAPLLLSAFEEISTVPDLVFVDGQGIAHPRRLGIGAHLGLILDLPTIGCAKSRLRGTFDPVPEKAGKFSRLMDGEEQIGAVVRTKTSVKPVFVSVGHRINLDNAIDWTLKCCRGLRLPEPCRLAHMASVGSDAISHYL